MWMDQIKIHSLEQSEKELYKKVFEKRDYEPKFNL